MKINLPEIVETVKDMSNISPRGLFHRNPLFPWNNGRYEAEAELMKVYLECNKDIIITKLQIDKEIRMKELELRYGALEDLDDPELIRILADVLCNL